MELTLKIIRVIIWWMIFELAASAGVANNPFLLGFAIAMMTYWYWRYPPFKKD